MTMPSNPFGNLDETAVSVHEMFQSYLRAGFRRSEALELMKAHIAAASAINAQQPEDTT